MAICASFALLSLLTTAILKTDARPSSYAVWTADSVISRGQGHGLDSNGQVIDSYEHGEFQWALRLLYEKTGNKTYFDYIQSGIDNVVTPNGTVLNFAISDYTLDAVRIGPTFLYLYEKTKLAKYKTAADSIREQLETQPRTPQGQYWHKIQYFDQGWLDGIYMGDVFYAAYTQAFQPRNLSAWADVTKQFRLMFENTLQNATAPNSTGLLYHGYDYSKTAIWADADRGHSPEVWIRALGWYMMALVDALAIIPESNPGHAELLSFLRILSPRIRDAADKNTGVWWLVMSQPGRAGNYFESSGASMFICSVLKAVRLGYVSDRDGSLVRSMKRAYEYAVHNWVIPNQNGTMDFNNTVIVGTLDGDASYERYIAQAVNLNDLKGTAAFVLASLEYEAL